VDKKSKLDELAEEIFSCTCCPLYKKAKKAVPGEGNPDAEVMFIGEAPGFYEDQKGIPFCGAAGNFLDKLLSRIKLRRKDVFISNVVKHRPPGNRDPQPGEIEACEPFLDRQIEIINPKIIVTLGRFAMNKFLPSEYISRVHGQVRFVNFAGKRRMIIPMYHPAAGLRRGKIKEETERDFDRLKKILEEKEEPVEKKEKSDKSDLKEKVFQLEVFSLNEKNEKE